MARGKPPTPDELPALTADVSYELELFDHAVARWAAAKQHSARTRDEQLDEFAWMELSMLHARNLCAFFSGRDRPSDQLACPDCSSLVACVACSNRAASNDDVFALDWLPGWGKGEEKDTVKELKKVTQKLNKWLMHITASRARDRTKQPAWSPIEVQQEVHALWSKFRSELSEPDSWGDPDPAWLHMPVAVTATSSTSPTVITASDGVAFSHPRHESPAAEQASMRLRTPPVLGLEANRSLKLPSIDITDD